MNEMMLEKIQKKVIEEIESEKDQVQTANMELSLSELATMYVEGDFKIPEEFENLFRWDNYQKTRLIESVLIGLPMPSIFVIEDYKGRWELIDGFQRLFTIFSFLGQIKNCNTWKLEKGDLLKEIDGLSYDELPINVKNLIRRYVCRVEIIYCDNGYEGRYDICERLKPNKNLLSSQEIRNLIYRSDSNNFIKFLTKNGNNVKFKDLIKISKNNAERLYAEELVLRFFSLLDCDKITKNLSDYLDERMKKFVRETTYDVVRLNKLEDLFNKTINLLIDLNKSNVFWRNGECFSPALYDGIMIGLARNIEKYESNIDALSQKIDELIKNDEFKSYSTDDAQSLMCRLNIADKIFKEL